MQTKKNDKSVFNNSRGFSLLEVLLGVTVFMIGMLGVTALNISSLKSNTFAGNMSEAVFLASNQIEELLVIDFEDALLVDTDGDGQGPVQDTDDDGLDDDDPEDTDAPAAIDGKLNFGLDDCPACNGEAADFEDLGVGRNGLYRVYYNVAEGEPLAENTKTINIIVEWSIKGVVRRINMTTVRMDHPDA